MIPRRIALTGGIACGKSLLSSFLRDEGLPVIDADEIVHELIPAAERKRLAEIVFRDPVERRRLEERIHPQVRERISRWFAEGCGTTANPPFAGVAAVPLLFEAHWDADFDTILCVVSSRDKQIERMTADRCWTREHAEARISAQMDIDEKAKRSHYVIRNEGSREELRSEAAKFAAWLRG